MARAHQEWAKRAERAVKLREAGETYETIGAILGVSRQRAHEIVRRQIEKHGRA